MKTKTRRSKRRKTAAPVAVVVEDTFSFDSTTTIFSSDLTGNVQNLQQLTLPAKKLFAVGPFLQATDGNLWNTSYVGGTSGLGIAFAVKTSGAMVDTLSFSPSVGASPIGGVIQTTDGTLFGTASVDGTVNGQMSAHGTVYRITSLPPKH